MIPSVVVVEFIKIAGSIIGKEQAKIKLKIWIGSGVEVISMSEEIAFLAGEIALQYRDVPIADVIISATAKHYSMVIVTDDLHFSTLGMKTIWYK